MSEQHLYYSSQFAEMASVSVRTLRYYDKMGLLSPSYYTDAGYRLYTDKDLLSLQSILMLKFLGFSLEEIKILLQTGPRRLEDLLAQHKAMMLERRAEFDRIIKAIEETEQVLRTEQCDWEALIKVVQVIKLGEEHAHWAEKHMTQEQRKALHEATKDAYDEKAKQRLKELHPEEWTEEDQKRCDEQYAFVKRELGRLVAMNADPASPEAQEVARVKHELSFGFSKGDPDVEAALKKWWEGYWTIPEELRPFDLSNNTYTPEERELLEKALVIYKHRYGIER